MVDGLEARLTDPGIETQPALRTLIDEYRDRRPEALEGTHELHYYLGTEVDRLEVYTRGRREQTPGEKLATIPLLGLLFTPFITRRTTYSESELQDRMADLLDKRLRTIETEFVNHVPGWSASRCSTLDLVGLSTQFWNGEAIDVLDQQDGQSDPEPPEAEQ